MGAATIWPFKSKSVPVEVRGGPSASDPVTADHWIVRLVDSLNQAGYDVTGDGALRQTAVYACVRVLSETIASLPLYLYKRNSDESKEPARDHPLWPILHDSPNNYQTSLEYFEMGVGHLCLRGNHYSFIERSNGGKILRLVPFHPDRIKPKMKNADRQILAYEYTDDKGQVSEIPAEDMWHLKGLTSDGFVGISPITMAKNAVRLAAISEDHGITYFGNGARSSGIVELPGRLSDPARLRLQQNMQEEMTGSNKFKIHVFEQGMKWHTVSLTNEDSQYLETRNFQVEEIARLFRVPCILIGHPDKSSTYASAEQFMMSFVVHTIRPWLVRIEQSINKYLLSEEDRKTYFAKFKLEGLLRGDTASRYAAYNSAITARWMNPNEVRELEDMNPREGGDEFSNPAIDLAKAKKEEEGKNVDKPKPPE